MTSENMITAHEKCSLEEAEDILQKHKIEKFTKRKITISHDEAWELVAVANRLASANGGYRGDAGGPIVFMTFGKLELKMGNSYHS